MRIWAEFVLRHRKWVVGFWGLVIVVGVMLVSTVNDRLTIDFSLPGQPGTETAHKIEKLLGNGGNTSPYLVTVTMPAGKTITGNEAAVQKTFAAVADSVPNQHLRVLDEANTGDKAFRTADDRTAYALVFYLFNHSPSQKLLTDPIRDAAQQAGPAGRHHRRDRRGRAGLRRQQQRPRRARRDAARRGRCARRAGVRLRLVPRASCRCSSPRRPSSRRSSCCCRSPI